MLFMKITLFMIITVTSFITEILRRDDITLDYATLWFLSGLINESVLVQEFLVGKEYVIDKVKYTRPYYPRNL